MAHDKVRVRFSLPWFLQPGLLVSDELFPFVFFGGIVIMTCALVGVGIVFTAVIG